MNQCRKCNQVKDLNSFYKHKSSIGGRWFRCKSCIGVERKERYASLKDEAKAYTKQWKKDNKGMVNAVNSLYRAAKLQRTPKWLTVNQIEEIRQIYLEAKELQWLNNNQILHVDHIVPLQGENVSGLHVPWNLQILPAPLNISKSNKHENN